MKKKSFYIQQERICSKFPHALEHNTNANWWDQTETFLMRRLLHNFIVCFLYLPLEHLGLAPVRNRTLDQMICYSNQLQQLLCENKEEQDLVHSVCYSGNTIYCSIVMFVHYSFQATWLITISYFSPDLHAKLLLIQVRFL